MNNKTYKNFTRPLFSLVLCLSLLFSIFTISIYGAEDGGEIEYHVFYMKDDESAIYDELFEYKAYSIPIGYYLCDNTAYVYATPIDVDDPYGDVCVYTPYVGSDLYWIDGVYYSDVIFLSDTATAKLESFFSGEYSSYALADEFGMLAGMSEDSYHSLVSSTTDMRTIDVRELGRLERYDIYAYDSTGAIYRTLGAFYITDNGTPLYVDYTTLENNYFDADGNFSYRSGTVSAAVLDATGMLTLTGYIEVLDYPYYDYTYEDGDYSGGFGDIMLVFFWVLLIAVGIVLPIIVVAISIFLPPFLERKRVKRIMSFAGAANGVYPEEFTPTNEPGSISPEVQKKKCRFTPWTLVTILGIAWLILGIAIILILILG